MRKKTIAWLFIPGVILTIIGYAIYLSVAGSAIAAASAGNTTATIGAGAYAGIALAAVGGILTFISWIGSLIATAKQGRWGWFVLVFLVSGLGQLIYLIAGPGL